MQQRMWTWVESNELGQEAGRRRAESRKGGGAASVSVRVLEVQGCAMPGKGREDLSGL